MFRVITEQDQLRRKLPTDMAGFVNQNFNVFILFKSSGRSISIRQSHSIIFRKASKVRVFSTGSIFTVVGRLGRGKGIKDKVCQDKFILLNSVVRRSKK